MLKMPSLFHGAIALEYGEIASSIRASDDDITDSCGSDCTNQVDCSRGHEAEGSCPVIPGREPKTEYEAFAPAVAGWSEPPADRN